MSTPHHKDNNTNLVITTTLPAGAASARHQPDNSPPPAVPRMDEETERLIFRVTDAGIAHGYASESAPVDEMREAEDALRLRIQQLLSEARAEGAQAMWTEIDTKGLPHD